MSRFIAIALLCLSPLCLSMPCAGAPAYATEAPDPSGVECCGCGARSSNPAALVHRPGCPYGPGGGTPNPNPREERAPRSPDQEADFAMSMLFPIPLAGGVVFGGIWHVKRLCGGFRGQSAAGSWNQYILQHYPLGGKGASGGVWGRLGGLPFLVIYPVSFGVKQGTMGLVWCGKQTGSGIAWCGRKTVAPFQVHPTPSRDQYRVIADYYEGLRDQSEAVRLRLAERVEGAEARAERYLDEFIADRAELREILAKEGREVARARARKILDAWAGAYRQKQALSTQLAADKAELERLRDGAYKKAMESARDYVLWDRPTDQASEKWMAMLTSGQLTTGEYKRLFKDLVRLESIKNVKTMAGVGEHAAWLYKSHKARMEFAEAEDQDKGRMEREWLKDPEVREHIGRMYLNVLDKSGWSERGMDLGYAGAARLWTAGEIDKMQKELDNLATVRWSQDVYARDWIRRTNEVEAWKRQEVSSRALRDKYDAEAKKNAQKSGRK